MLSILQSLAAAAVMS